MTDQTAASRRTLDRTADSRRAIQQFLNDHPNVKVGYSFGDAMSGVMIQDKYAIKETAWSDDYPHDVHCATPSVIPVAALISIALLAIGGVVVAVWRRVVRR